MDDRESRRTVFELMKRTANVERKRAANDALRLNRLQKQIDERKIRPTVVDLGKTNVRLSGEGRYIRPTLVAEQTSSKLRNFIMGSMRAKGWVVNRRGDRLNLYDLVYRGYPDERVIKIMLEAPDSVDAPLDRKRAIIFGEGQGTAELMRLI